MKNWYKSTKYSVKAMNLPLYDLWFCNIKRFDSIHSKSRDDNNALLSEHQIQMCILHTLSTPEKNGEQSTHHPLFL